MITQVFWVYVTQFDLQCGIDGISPKFVKMARVVLTPILTKLYNKCLQQECFPDEFKVGQVIPIPKTLTPKELGEFRPISLLNLFSKIFEKVLKTKIMDFIDKYNILSPEQFGFTTNSSTELAITTIYDKFLDNLDKNQYTCAIFLDIKKAFDSLDHKILLKKLDHYGFRGKIWNLLKSYMENRKICTKVDQKASKHFKVTHGIPQGSVLGPLFFCYLLMIYLKHQSLMLLCLRMMLTCIGYFPPKSTQLASNG